MDFITQLTLSNNFDSILVAVDIFSKMAIFIPAYGTITALEWTDREGKSDSRTVSLDVYSPAGKLSTRIDSLQQVVEEEFESAIRRFKKYAHRNRIIPPNFPPGDKVWLASKNIKTTRPTKELSERWLGPFEVIKKIGIHSYHLKLPLKWKAVHHVFHVSLLEPVKQSSMPNCNQLPPPQLLVEECQVESM
ncbi:hypothetical protein O181_120166 [Austropuccinia psidii MF-1]|uniref:Tf2-1-like SH3-like domain-containing protein n=1 Tax=Austropuccinia psidii MF-1 TaxID=1389203 RepID=A0A9Q3KHX3_9BASI|nr:hypothetical protein [Austropuccinia psidii MF-1]